MKLNRVRTLWAVAAAAALGLALTGCPWLPPCTSWVVYIGTDGDDGAFAIARTNDGGYAVAGFTEPLHEEDDDVQLVKLDAHGAPLWTQQFGDNRDDRAYGVAQATDGGLAVAGIFGDSLDPQSDGFLIKTDASGVEEWRVLIDSGGADGVYSVAAASDGGFVLGAMLDMAGGHQAALIKIDALGVEEWRVTVEDGMHVAGVAQSTDGGFLMGGYHILYDPLEMTATGSLRVLKVDADGQETWDLNEQVDHGITIRGMCATADGGCALAGQDDVFGGVAPAVVWKITADGQVDWYSIFGAGLRNMATGIVQTRDGGFGITGELHPDGELTEIFLAKMDGNGDIEYMRAFGGDDTDKGYGIVEASPGGFVIAGLAESFEEAGEQDHSDIIVIRTDCQGHAEEVEVDLGL